MPGHLPANFFNKEIEIKDRVAIMLFKLKQVFLSTYPGCQRSSRSPAARSVRASSARRFASLVSRQLVSEEKR